MFNGRAGKLWEGPAQGCEEVFLKGGHFKCYFTKKIALRIDKGSRCVFRCTYILFITLMSFVM